MIIPPCFLFNDKATQFTIYRLSFNAARLMAGMIIDDTTGPFRAWVYPEGGLLQWHLLENFFLIPHSKKVRWYRIQF